MGFPNQQKGPFSKKGFRTDTVCEEKKKELRIRKNKTTRTTNDPEKQKNRKTHQEAKENLPKEGKKYVCTD